MTAHYPATAPKAAVIFRTYQWDGFIERQLDRFRSVSAGTDLFVSADVTRGPIGPITHDRVFETTDAGLVAMGLPNRFDKGSLIWWNNDYPTYAFHQAFPDYDYYVFVEYDSVIQAPIATMVADIALQGLDFVAEPIPHPLGAWFWWPYARQVYGRDELHASLNCISVFSNRALSLLFARRLAMAAMKSTKFWPISEAFVATEIARKGYKHAPLSRFGGVAHYKWFPPMLEQDISPTATSTFLHPVLDPPRYAASVLRNGDSWRDYFRVSSPLRQRLSRLPDNVQPKRLARAAWDRFKTLRQDQWERSLLWARLLFKS